MVCMKIKISKNLLMTMWISMNALYGKANIENLFNTADILPGPEDSVVGSSGIFLNGG